MNKQMRKSNEMPIEIVEDVDAILPIKIEKDKSVAMLIALGLQDEDEDDAKAEEQYQLNKINKKYVTVDVDVPTLAQTPTQTATPIKKTTKPKKILEPLLKCYENNLRVEIGVDEAGRGPLFGRVYSGAVILPKDDSFDHSRMKDSKKFHSKKKIVEVAEYIKQHSLAWGVGYVSENEIDHINILQATQLSMHKAITNAINQRNATIMATSATATSTELICPNNLQLLIDGNYFKPYYLNNEKAKYTTIEGGDNAYSSIAAASILAKVSRDEYIDKLCEEHPFLSEKYGIDSNKGYGSKKHMDGIKTHGITEWHRKSFGICKNY